MVQGVGDIDAIWFLDFKPCFVPYKVFDEEWATIVCAVRYLDLVIVRRYKNARSSMVLHVSSRLRYGFSKTMQTCCHHRIDL